MNNKRRVVIYARVSTKDRQEVANQLRILRRVVKDDPMLMLRTEYVDRESGAKPDRVAFRTMFEAAHRREFDLVLFWALDRLTREGALKTLHYLTELESYGVSFRSHTEQYLDSAGLFRDAIVSILATLAKQERVRRGERTRAGLERAVAQGKRLGRPPLSPALRLKIETHLARKKTSVYAAAKRLGLPYTTVHRVATSQRLKMSNTTRMRSRRRSTSSG